MRMNSGPVTMFVVLLIGSLNGFCLAEDADPAAVKQIFRTRCLECHGDIRREADLHIFEIDSYVGEGKAVVPGDLDQSYLFDMIASEDESYRMPESPRPALSVSEVEIVRHWISGGAPDFPVDVQNPVEGDSITLKPSGDNYVLERILDFLKSVPRDQRIYYRFFSSNHLVTSGATAEELKLNELALAKAVNHLSWQPSLVQPTAIDGELGSVFAIDIRRLGWHEHLFHAVTSHGSQLAEQFDLFDMVLLEYPYGIVSVGSENYDQLAETFLQPAGLIRPIPYVRIDWFVSVVTQPTMYEDMLQLPRRLDELERMLGVDGDGNLESYVARRAGMTLSGVSQNNRVVERHPARFGYYWKSFDFETSSGLQNMFVDPIDFNYAGGEMIWSLPNGLQGYLVTDNQGNRIDEAPTSIVTDKFSEDKTVRNGLACMRCHDKGMKRFRDNVRPAFEALNASAHRRSVLRLYPEVSEMERLLDEDQTRFLNAMNQTAQNPSDREPLTPVARTFLDAPLTLQQAAAELSQRDAVTLTAVFRLPQFARLGLAGLSAGNVIRRDSWEDYYDRVVRHLGLGTPIAAVDGVTTRDHLPDGFSDLLTIQTNRSGNVFSPGDEMFLTINNESDADMFIELFGTSSAGKVAVLTPEVVTLRRGQTYRFPESGTIQIRPQLGREFVTVFGRPRVFEPAVVLRGSNMADRIVHPFFGLDEHGQVADDAIDFVKKTLTIETR